MKKLLLFLLMLLCTIDSSALRVSFSSQKFDGKVFLVLRTNIDDDKVLPKDVVIKFYLSNGSKMILGNSENAKFGLGVSADGSRLYYRYEVTEEMKKSLSVGIKGIVINSLPELYTEKFSEKQSNKFIKMLSEPEETDDL